MKNLIFSIVILAALTISTFANGETPIGGGRTCPNNQTTCLVSEPDPNSTKTNSDTDTDAESDETIFNELITYLKSIFE